MLPPDYYNLLVSNRRLSSLACQAVRGIARLPISTHASHDFLMLDPKTSLPKPHYTIFMASFDIIPYTGPPVKHPRSSNKPKATIEDTQAASSFQDVHQVCPGDDRNRSHLVCSIRSSIESSMRSEWGPAQHGTKAETVNRQTQSLLRVKHPA